MILSLLATIVIGTNSVTFTATSTDCGLDAPVEFLFVGPGSDHDYEAVFMTEDSLADLAAAFEKAGLKKGEPVSQKGCRFWPIGTKVTMKPDVWSILRDMRNERRQAPVWTGGTRESDGAPVAATNMPLAVFALYNLPQSLFQFDDALDQSVTYGRFQPAVKIKKGEARSFTVSWTNETNGGKHVLTPDFPGEMTVAEAIKRARLYAELDSPEMKINGFKDGQFFYRAFLPLEQWRDRRERLMQPYEVRLGGAQPTVTVIREDWSDTTKTEPKLIVTEKKLDEIKNDDSPTDTCFIFAPNKMQLKDVYSIPEKLPKKVVNWYVYGEE